MRAKLPANLEKQQQKKNMSTWQKPDSISRKNLKSPGSSNNWPIMKLSLKLFSFAGKNWKRNPNNYSGMIRAVFLLIKRIAPVRVSIMKTSTPHTFIAGMGAGAAKGVFVTTAFAPSSHSKTISLM